MIPLFLKTLVSTIRTEISVWRLSVAGGEGGATQPLLSPHLLLLQPALATDLGNQCVSCSSGLNHWHQSFYRDHLHLSKTRKRTGPSKSSRLSSDPALWACIPNKPAIGQAVAQLPPPPNTTLAASLPSYDQKWQQPPAPIPFDKLYVKTLLMFHICQFLQIYINREQLFNNAAE